MVVEGKRLDIVLVIISKWTLMGDVNLLGVSDINVRIQLNNKIAWLLKIFIKAVCLVILGSI